MSHGRLTSRVLAYCFGRLKVVQVWAAALERLDTNLYWLHTLARRKHLHHPPGKFAEGGNHFMMLLRSIQSA